MLLMQDESILTISAEVLVSTPDAALMQVLIALCCLAGQTAIS